MKNKLRRALLERQVTLGSWIQIGHPAGAEVLARAGFDWVCVDLEHGAIDLETTANIFRALGGFDCVPVARLPLNDPIWIHRVLDAGARGLIIPMVKTAAEAEAAVREAKYPPRGARGFGFSRANQHGADFDSYIAAANDEIAMIMQIEHKDAIVNLDAILRVDGVDGVFIGPLDLSGSLGITGQLIIRKWPPRWRSIAPPVARRRNRPACTSSVRTRRTSAARWMRATRCSRSAWTMCLWSKARARRLKPPGGNLSGIAPPHFPTAERVELPPFLSARQRAPGPWLLRRRQLPVARYRASGL